MAEFGIVKNIIDDYVELELQRSEACKHCNACLPSLTGKTMILRAQNKCGAEIGDMVRVSVEQNGFLSAVALLYVIPAAVFILLVALFSLFSLNEWLVLGIAVIGVAISYLIIHRIAPKLNQQRYTPIAEEILPPLPTKTE